MEPTDALEEMCRISGVTRYAVAKHLGCAPQSLYRVLRQRSDHRIGTVLGVCEATGFKMILVNDDGVEIPVELPPKEN